MQEIDGKFSVKFHGTPIFFVSKTSLTSEKGNTAIVYSIHITPFFAFGFVIKKSTK